MVYVIFVKLFDSVVLSKDRVIFKLLLLFALIWIEKAVVFFVILRIIKLKLFFILVNDIYIILFFIFIFLFYDVAIRDFLIHPVKERNYASVVSYRYTKNRICSKLIKIPKVVFHFIIIDFIDCKRYIFSKILKFVKEFFVCFFGNAFA